jgi:hypothetical protein
MKSDNEILIDIERKLDDVRENIHNIDKSQIEMKKDLSYHIKRTDLLQDEVTHLSDRIKPIESIKFTWQNIFKLITFFTAVSTLATAAFAALSYLNIIKN